MFRVFCFVIFFLLPGFALSVRANDIPEPREMRKQLLVALERRSLADSLYTELNGALNKSALNTCYLGVVQALKAKHAWNPYYKLKYLSDSEKTLKTAVAKDPDNIEIRFMRFSIVHNVPGFLGYNKHLADDREEMIRQLNKKFYATADKDVVKTIMKFLIESKRCTAAETENLHKQLAALK